MKSLLHLDSNSIVRLAVVTAIWLATAKIHVEEPLHHLDSAGTTATASDDVLSLGYGAAVKAVLGFHGKNMGMFAAALPTAHAGHGYLEERRKSSCECCPDYYHPELGYGLCRYPPFDYRPADDGWAWDNDGGRCEDFAGQSQPLRKVKTSDMDLTDDELREFLEDLGDLPKGKYLVDCRPSNLRAGRNKWVNFGKIPPPIGELPPPLPRRNVKREDSHDTSTNETEAPVNRTWTGCCLGRDDILHRPSVSGDDTDLGVCIGLRADHRPDIQGIASFTKHAKRDPFDICGYDDETLLKAGIDPKEIEMFNTNREMWWRNLHPYLQRHLKQLLEGRASMNHAKRNPFSIHDYDDQEIWAVKLKPDFDNDPNASREDWWNKLPNWLRVHYSRQLVQNRAQKKRLERLEKERLEQKKPV